MHVTAGYARDATPNPAYKAAEIASKYVMACLGMQMRSSTDDRELGLPEVDKEITLDFEWAGPVDRLPEVAFEAARVQLRRVHAERQAKGVASTLVLTPPAWE